jgi:hypothetical protein
MISCALLSSLNHQTLQLFADPLPVILPHLLVVLLPLKAKVLGQI